MPQTQERAKADSLPFPFDRGGCPMRPAPELAEIRRRGPERVRLWDGSEPWLITGHDDAREVLRGSGTTVSSDYRRPDFPAMFPWRRYNHEVPEANIRMVTEMDPPEHTAHRRLFTSEFKIKSIKALTPVIEAVVESRLDAVEQAGRPADLVSLFCAPIPGEMICHILGFSAERGKQFGALAEELQDQSNSDEDVQRIFAAMLGHVDSQVEVLREEPNDGFINRLLEAHDRGEIPFEDVRLLAFTLFLAGYETTSHGLAQTILELLSNPEAAAALRDGTVDPAVAVDELLRVTSIVHLALERVALEPIEVGGRRIEEGEGVLISLQAANFDPAVFPHPERLDFGRENLAGQIIFADGIHQCPGQQLARAELRIALPRLLRRFPELRLVDEPDAHHFKSTFIYGLDELRVAW